MERGNFSPANASIVMLNAGGPQAFAKLVGEHAKNDQIDAQIIARFTAFSDQEPRETDPRIDKLRENLRLLEQIEEDRARWKTRLENYDNPKLRREIETGIGSLSKQRNTMRTALLKALARHDDLAYLCGGKCRLRDA